MSEPQNTTSESPEAIRAELGRRLRARCPEIEKAITMKIRHLADPIFDEDPAYAADLQSAAEGALRPG